MAIQNAPSLLMGLEFTYGAFMDLTLDRPMGWGPGAIPWSVIYDYARCHGLHREECEDLAYHLRRMDEAFLRYHDEKTSKR